MKYHRTLFWVLFMVMSCQNDAPDPMKNPADPDPPQMPAPDPPQMPASDEPKPDRPGPSVYFIGNSLTYVYNIPGLFDAQMKSNEKATLRSGDPYKGYFQTTPGAGRILERLQRYDNSNAIFQILTKRPRYIVLQEQSGGLVPNTTEYFIHHFLALATAAQAEIVLYQTWHHDSIIQNYRSVAETYRITLLPAGEIWKALAGMGAPIATTDEVHQNRFGSEVIAKAFYYLLEGQELSAPEGAHDKVIFDRVRNASDVQVQLHGLAQTPAGSGGVRYKGDVGDTLETAAQLHLSPRSNTIHLNPYDVDIYLLPMTDEGQSLQLTAIDGNGISGFDHSKIGATDVIPNSPGGELYRFANTQPFKRSIIGLGAVFFDEDKKLLKYETTGQSSDQTAVILKLHTTPDKKNYLALVMGDFKRLVFLPIIARTPLRNDKAIPGG